ncbi:hypothetical protein HDU85_006631 [Gaertneriomyces sp. JEL0708]|nr:hypothetical protein HDU85_006631 [Gaertneriomyces sp. JEL0708]
MGNPVGAGVHSPFPRRPQKSMPITGYPPLTSLVFAILVITLFLPSSIQVEAQIITPTPTSTSAAGPSATALANQTWVILGNDGVWSLGGRIPDWEAFGDSSESGVWGGALFFNKSYVPSQSASGTSMLLQSQNVLETGSDNRSPLWGRVGHTSVAIGDDKILVLFGQQGYPLSYVPANEAVIIDTKAKRWQTITTSEAAPGGFPRRRAHHVAVYDRDTDSVYVYSGQIIDEEGNPVPDVSPHRVHALDIQTWTWASIPLPSTNTPAVIDGNAMLYNNTMVVCFGNSFDLDNPCQLFDTKSHAWSLPTYVNNTKPGPRQGASVVQLINDTRTAFIFGGVDPTNGLYLGDLWRLELDTLPALKWFAEPLDRAPEPRAFHVTADFDGVIGIYGGQGQNSPMNSTISFFNQGVWTRGSVHRLASGRTQRPPLSPDEDPNADDPTSPGDGASSPSGGFSSSQIGMAVGIGAAGLITVVGAAVVVRRTRQMRHRHQSPHIPMSSGPSNATITRPTGLFLKAVENRLRMGLSRQATANNSQTQVATSVTTPQHSTFSMRHDSPCTPTAPPPLAIITHTSPSPHLGPPPLALLHVAATPTTIDSAFTTTSNNPRLSRTSLNTLGAYDEAFESWAREGLDMYRNESDDEMSIVSPVPRADAEQPPNGAEYLDRRA